MLEEQEPPRSHRTERPPIVYTADFHTGRPDLRRFPRFLWRQLMSRAEETLPVEAYGYTGPQGLGELRKEIAAWLLRSRGISADPEDIFVTAGATQALRLLADLLCVEGKKVILEDPCHRGMLDTFLSLGSVVVPVPADEHGIMTEQLPPNGKDFCAVYVTPSHQFPLGGILPAERRSALVRYARDNKLYIIEDDYDSEFRYTGDPVAPLYATDPNRVVYVGTFSKTLFPALRIGYVILPEALQKAWRTLRTHTDVQNPPFEQAALAELLGTGRFDRHIQAMRRLYSLRRKVLLEALYESFGDGWTAYGDAAGLHVAVDFPGMRFDETFGKVCLQRGIYVIPLERHCIVKGQHQSKLLLGYGHLEPDEIRNGIRLLAEAMSLTSPYRT
jgi:GntR family transcriptional regulator/MocR family aminotransferase